MSSRRVSQLIAVTGGFVLVGTFALALQQRVDQNSAGFQSVELIFVQQQGRIGEAQVLLHFETDRLVFETAETNQVVCEVFYFELEGAQYSWDPQPHWEELSGRDWDPALPGYTALTFPFGAGLESIIKVPGKFSRKQHWLSLQTSLGTVLLRLNDKNYQQILAMLETFGKVEIVSVIPANP